MAFHVLQHGFHGDRKYSPLLFTTHVGHDGMLTVPYSLLKPTLINYSRSRILLGRTSDLWYMSSIVHIVVLLPFGYINAMQVVLVKY